jgi:capsular exopolysaccharide synthesis family protein
MFSRVDNPYKTILVSSSVPGEGKTSCSVNLATAFARAGQKTIIVDIDLRKPRIHKAFKLNTVKGLTSVLAADVEIERVIKTNVMENLDVLPAGIRPPNPAELLGSQAMEKLIARLQELYDIVILDSPPVGVFTDAATIAGKVDGVIYVVSAGVAGYVELSRGIESLKNVGSKMIGFVMTRVETDSKGRDYYNYKYSYYYGDNKGK